METKLNIEIKERNLFMSEGWFVYAVLIKHYYVNIFLLLKLCKYEGGWGQF